MRERNVDYSIEIVDEIPTREVARSPLEDALDKIEAAYNAQPETNRRPVTAVIGWYGLGSACTAAANVLRQRHGTQDVEGWRFETRRTNRNVKDGDGNVVKDEDGKSVQEEVHGLYVNYDPSKCVPGARELWDKKMKERAAELEVRRKEREAAEAAAATASSNPPPAPPPPPAPAPQPTANDGGKTPQAPPKPQPAQPAVKK